MIFTFINTHLIRLYNLALLNKRSKIKKRELKRLILCKSLILFKENNAIAVVNLETENVTAIHGLGFKNWSNFKLDASDRDNGKNL